MRSPRSRSPARPDFGQFSDAGAVATELAHELGSTAGTFFAIVLLNASLIGAAAVTLATSYAFGDVFGAKHSLNRGPLDAKLFYASFALMVLAAAGIVLIPGAPLGLITTSVQALAGVLLPSATVFLLLLCNDREVLGPWSNSPWLNAIASVIIGVLVELSLILMASTMFPTVNVTQLFVYLSLVLLVGLAADGVYAAAQPSAEPRRVSRRRSRSPRRAARQTWTMPPLALLERPVWSPGRKAGDAPAARLSGRGRAAADRQDRAARPLRLAPGPPRPPPCIERLSPPRGSSGSADREAAGRRASAGGWSRVAGRACAGRR